VTLAAGAFLTSAVTYLAVDQGFFAAEGLEVELVLMNRGGASLPALSSGDIDAANSGPINPRYFNVIQRGAHLRFVAARSFYDPAGCAHEAFVARTDLLDSGRLSDEASLAGLRITTERTASNYFYFSRLLALGRLTIADVELVDLPVAARLDAFDKGLIDVATATEPWVTRLVRAGKVKVWHPVSDVLPGQQVSFLIFGRRLLEERRDLGLRVLRGYAKAARHVREEGKSQRNIESLARRTRFDAEELREMCWPAVPADLRVDPRTLEEYQQWALESGLIDVVVPYEMVVDSGFVDALAAEQRRD